MNNTGKIYAFDKDRRRLDTLIKLTGKAGCKNIEPLHESFLDSDPTCKKFEKVEYILLDPSCSGSGIVGRMDHLLQEEETEQEAEEQEERLDCLADFQKEALLHAFKFPNIKKVVYSTCSKHIQENENVVQYVLQQRPDFKLESGVFPGWKRRGVDGEGYDGNDVIRTLPEEDKTIGFFVALFNKVA
jgi:25S rRNA (cytosine2278-C5)-methyltransferase